jgi:hypothetical protein
MLVVQSFTNFAGRNFTRYGDDARFFGVAGKEKAEAEAKAEAKGRKRYEKDGMFSLLLILIIEIPKYKNLT